MGGGGGPPPPRFLVETIFPTFGGGGGGSIKVVTRTEPSGLSSLKGDAKPGGLRLTPDGFAVVALQLVPILNPRARQLVHTEAPRGSSELSYSFSSQANFAHSRRGGAPLSPKVYKSLLVKVKVLKLCRTTGSYPSELLCALVV